MEETAEVNAWHRPMHLWDSWECVYFVKWFAEVGTSFDSMAEVLEGYRAVRDVEASVQETVIYKTTERYGTGWVDARGIFGSLK